jgi:hypothetical protein
MSSRPLEVFAARAAHEPGFLAHDFARYEALVDLSGPSLIGHLGVDQEALWRLAACRTPRRDEGFAEEVMQVAQYADAQPAALAHMLRVLDAVQALRALPEGASQALLAAARDDARERTAPQERAPEPGLVPKWVTDAARLIWGSEELTSSFPRDLELAVLWRLPLAIVEIEGLTSATVTEWLHGHGVHFKVASAPRGLRGALVAYGGSGLLFVEEHDDLAERRLTVAHEAGHFVADYLLPRQHVARRAPHLLDVVDGLREASDADQVDALLGRVTLGAHSHLFERDASGGYLRADVDASEERATRIAWELLAPANEVASNAKATDPFSLVRVLQDSFGMPTASARDYAQYLLKPSSAGKDRWSFDG